MTQLYIAKSGAQHAPTLPLDAVTRTIAVLGQRGTGKTNSAVVIAEEMARKGGHVAILDPVGAHYGITRKGEKRGIPGIVIGGEHGDVPLEETGGQLVAELVVGRHWPVVVIDMKMLRKGAQLRFMADYLEGLFHQNREPLCQVFEEADRPLPQQGRGQFDVTAARVLGAGEDIVKLGRSRGLGAILVTQRPASLNKNVLEVCESLLLHRLMGPNDRKAIKGWVEANGDPDALKLVMDSMASLKLGEAWLYSPGWLGKTLATPITPRRTAAGLARLRMRHRTTFDSSATPEIGQAVAEPTERAPVDLDVLREQMQASIEHAKANDPSELKRRIGELHKMLERSDERVAELEARAPEGEVVEREVEVLVPDPAAIAELADAAGDLRLVGESAERALAEARAHVHELETATRRAQAVGDQVEAAVANARGIPERRRVEERASASPMGSASPAMHPRADSTAGPAPRPADTASSNGDGKLAKAPRTLLQVLVSVWPRRLSRAELSTLSGYKPKSSTYRNALSALRTAGMLDESGGLFAPTQQGFDVFGGVPPEPKSPDDVRAMWRATFGNSAPGVLFDMLVEMHPESISREELARASGYSDTSSTFRNALSALKVNGLMEKGPDGFRASDSLFVTA